MKLFILRHGETEPNTRGSLQGWMDAPINENGRMLAVLTGRAMKGIRFDHCISSPLARARETAEIILRESKNTADIRFDDRLREIGFGEMEGKSIAEMGEEGDKLSTDPFHYVGFPNGESIADVCRRTQSFLKELIAEDDGKTYLISTHGCAMRAMINYLLDDPSDYWCGHVPYNCSFTIIEAKGGKARITEMDKVYYDRSMIVDHFKTITKTDYSIRPEED